MTELRNDFMLDSWVHFWQVKISIRYLTRQHLSWGKLSALKSYISSFPFLNSFWQNLKTWFMWIALTTNNCYSDIFLKNNCPGIICCSLTGTVRLIWCWHNFEGRLMEPSLTGYKCDRKFLFWCSLPTKQNLTKLSKNR